MGINPSSPKLIDLTGQRFGLLTVLSHRPDPASGWWLCQCACGRTCEKRSVCLRDGRSNNCGCVKRIRGLLHKTFPNEYRSWQSMKTRCENERDEHFPAYGGAGVKVCDEWSGRHGFVQFLADMGPKPSSAHSIDRIDNAKGYEPGNCRWATAKEQANNRTSNTLIEVDGVSRTLTQWSELNHVSPMTILRRLRNGLPASTAVLPGFVRAPRPRSFPLEV